MVRQKVPKSYFQRQFSMSKINEIFSKKNSFKNINLGDHFFKKTFFLTSIFDELALPIFSKYNGFHGPYTVAHTIDCVCSKILNHGLIIIFTLQAYALPHIQ